MAAFIFAAQMINFPVLGGTSGHLVGGALAAILLGPWAGMLVMVSVIGVQALLYQDGGLLVMGANIFNMGLIPTLIGYGLARGAAGRGRGLWLGVAGLAAWLSVVAGALFTALELWLSGTSLLAVVVPAMLSVHALIGIGEALISVAALAFILKTRPDLLEGEGRSGHGGRGWVLAGVLISLVVIFLSPLASANPDGLERVAQDLGFSGRAQAAPFGLLSDYTLPWIRDGGLSTILAGLAGLVVLAGVIWLFARLWARQK
jgi:cobalt/nickel transport system permease protein